MNEEFKKGVQNEAGKMVVRGIIALCGAVLLIVGITTQTVQDWLKGLHFSDAEILRLRIGACVVIVIILVVCVAAFVWLMKRGKRKQQAQHPLQLPPDFRAPPDLSNTPGKGAKFLGFGPEEIILGDLTFHILKAYNNFISPHAAMSVDMVSQYCRITRDEALPAVQELHKMNYIRTVKIMPGEWNSHYQITPIGQAYVIRHAT